MWRASELRLSGLRVVVSLGSWMRAHLSRVTLLPVVLVDHPGETIPTARGGGQYGSVTQPEYGSLTFADLVNPPNGTLAANGGTKDFDILMTASNSLPICATGGHGLSIPVSLDGVAS
jgi:hypothetical protein